MRKLITPIASLFVAFLCVGAATWEKLAVNTGTNGVVLQPTNFWTANSNGINAVILHPASTNLPYNFSANDFTVTQSTNIALKVSNLAALLAQKASTNQLTSATNDLYQAILSYLVANYADLGDIASLASTNYVNVATNFYNYIATNIAAAEALKATNSIPVHNVAAGSNITVQITGKTATVNADVSLLALAAMSNYFSPIFSVSDALPNTPPRGWNSWYMGDESAATEGNALAAADFLITNGLADLGYRYVVVDHGWTLPSTNAGARVDGVIQPDPAKFPSGMKTLVDTIHGKGLKFGITAMSGADHGGFTGSGGYFSQDAQTFADWGVDFIKFGVDDVAPTAQMNTLKAWYEAVEATKRPMYIYALGLTGTNSPLFMRYANAYRWFENVPPGYYQRMSASIIMAGSVPWLYARHNRFADWDALDWSSYDNSAINYGSWRTALGMSAMLRAQMFWKTHSLSPAAAATLLSAAKNTAMLAIHDDPAVATCIDTNTGVYTWLKNMADGSKAVAFMNANSAAAVLCSVSWTNIGLAPGVMTVQNAFAGTSASATNETSVLVSGMDIALLRISTPVSSVGQVYIAPGTNVTVGTNGTVYTIASDVGQAEIDELQGQINSLTGGPTNGITAEIATNIASYLDTQLESSLTDIINTKAYSTNLPVVAAGSSVTIETNEVSGANVYTVNAVGDGTGHYVAPGNNIIVGTNSGVATVSTVQSPSFSDITLTNTGGYYGWTIGTLLKSTNIGVVRVEDDVGLGDVVADRFIGNIDGTNVSSGTIPIARLSGITSNQIASATDTVYRQDTVGHYVTPGTNMLASTNGSGVVTLTANLTNSTVNFDDLLTGTNVWTGSNYFGGPFVVGGGASSNSLEVLGPDETTVVWYVTTNGVAYGDGSGLTNLTGVSGGGGTAWVSSTNGSITVTTNTSGVTNTFDLAVQGWNLISTDTNGIAWYTNGTSLIASNTGPAWTLLNTNWGIDIYTNGNFVMLSNSQPAAAGSNSVALIPGSNVTITTNVDGQVYTIASTGGGSATNAWGLDGNTIYDTNYIGTLNPAPIVFKAAGEVVGELVYTNGAPRITFGNSNTNESPRSTVSGGYQNMIMSGGENGSINGGSGNIIYQNAVNSTIIGGAGNSVGQDVNNAAVLGGGANQALANYTTVGGFNSVATNQGAFLWADGNNAVQDPFYSIADNEFAVRAQGGVRLVTGGAGLSVDGPVNISGATISGTNITDGTISTNKMDATAYAAFLGGSADPNALTNNDTRAITVQNSLTVSNNILRTKSLTLDSGYLTLTNYSGSEGGDIGGYYTADSGNDQILRLVGSTPSYTIAGVSLLTSTNNTTGKVSIFGRNEAGSFPAWTFDASSGVAWGNWGGNGGLLTNLNASNLATGTVPLDRLPTILLQNGETSGMRYLYDLTLRNLYANLLRITNTANPLQWGDGGRALYMTGDGIIEPKTDAGTTGSIRANLISASGAVTMSLSDAGDVNVTGGGTNLTFTGADNLNAYRIFATNELRTTGNLLAQGYLIFGGENIENVAMLGTVSNRLTLTSRYFDGPFSTKYGYSGVILKSYGVDGADGFEFRNNSDDGYAPITASVGSFSSLVLSNGLSGTNIAAGTISTNAMDATAYEAFMSGGNTNTVPTWTLVNTNWGIQIYTNGSSMFLSNTVAAGSGINATEATNIAAYQAEIATNALGSAAFTASTAYDAAGTALNATNGLGSAAFTESSAYDAAGTALNATNGLGSAAFTASTAYDAANSALNATNALWSTMNATNNLAYDSTTIPFRGVYTTVCSGNVSFSSGISGVVYGERGITELMIFPNGSDRTITLPSDWGTDDGVKTYYATNNMVGVLAVQCIPGVRTNAIFVNTR